MTGISEKKKFISIAELKSMGYTYYKIGKIEKEDKIKVPAKKISEQYDFEKKVIVTCDC